MGNCASVDENIVIPHTDLNTATGGEVVKEEKKGEVVKAGVAENNHGVQGGESEKVGKEDKENKESKGAADSARKNEGEEGKEKERERGEGEGKQKVEIDQKKQLRDEKKVEGKHEEKHQHQHQLKQQQKHQEKPQQKHQQKHKQKHQQHKPQEHKPQQHKPEEPKHQEQKSPQKKEEKIQLQADADDQFHQSPNIGDQSRNVKAYQFGSEFQEQLNQKKQNRSNASDVVEEGGAKEEQQPAQRT